MACLWKCSMALPLVRYCDTLISSSCVICRSQPHRTWSEPSTGVESNRVSLTKMAESKGPGMGMCVKGNEGLIQWSKIVPWFSHAIVAFVASIKSLVKQASKPCRFLCWNKIIFISIQNFHLFSENNWKSIGKRDRVNFFFADSPQKHSDKYIHNPLLDDPLTCKFYQIQASTFMSNSLLVCSLLFIDQDFYRQCLEASSKFTFCVGPHLSFSVVSSIKYRTTCLLPYWFVSSLSNKAWKIYFVQVKSLLFRNPMVKFCWRPRPIWP